MFIRNGGIVLHVDRPEIITRAIPHAKQFRIKGRELLALKHTLDNAKVLNNIGINAPSPLLYDGYRFTGRWTPMDHQVTTTEFLTMHRRAFVLNDMGTGKTSSALWALDYLIRRGKLKKVLIVSPLSVVGVWAEEAFNTVPHRSISQIVGTRSKRIELLEKEKELAVINFDGLKSIKGEVKKWKPDLIIVDEASAYCNPKTQRYKALRELAGPETFLWLLTGTPTPNAPTDSYGLIKLVAPENIHGSFTMYQSELMRRYGPYKWVPKNGATEKVNRLMQPAIRFKKNECTDLPDVTHNFRFCGLSAKQEKVFKIIKSKMRMEYEDSEISAVNAAVKLIKLQQIACGVVKDNEGNPVYLSPKPRLDLVKEIVGEANNKVIIACPFIFAMHMLANHLSEHWTTKIVNGQVKKSDRDIIFQQFQREKSPQVLVVHPKVTAHGLTLTAADTIIWYAPIFSTEQYEQLNARIDRLGQKNTMSIYHVYCNPFEKRIYDVLQSKSNMQSKLLDMYEEALGA